jgi:membrane-associated protease RseP (regulator of RpoE activity)
VDEAPPPAAEQRRHNYALHLGWFLATCVTTTWVGIVSKVPGVGWTDWGRLLTLVPEGLPYSASIMGILLCHEMGHFVLARRHGVDASLPYFIPLPFPPVGTLGAVIKMRGRVESRNALVDIGAAGPLAGLLVALPVLAYGIHLSPVQPIGGPGLLEGNSVLYLLVKYAVKGLWLPGNGVDVMLDPVAWAGWVGLLVTMLNLMPIGQLDGGHIAHAFFGSVHNRISEWLHYGLLGMFVLAFGLSSWELSENHPLGQALHEGFQAGIPWLVWALVLALMKRLSGGAYHPPVGEQPLSPGRKLLSLGMLALFLLLLIPIPLRWNS